MRVTLPYGGQTPYKKHGGDAGWDLASLYDCTVSPECAAIVELATRVNIPKGYVGILSLRSSMAAEGMACHNGTIDAGYTGPLKIVIWNHSNKTIHINKGDRIAQLVILPTPTVELTRAANLGVTERGDQGFGSTGK